MGVFLFNLNLTLVGQHNVLEVLDERIKEGALPAPLHPLRPNHLDIGLHHLGVLEEVVFQVGLIGLEEYGTGEEA